MNWKLLTGLACGMALLLGACSSNNAASGTTTGGSTGTGTDTGVGDTGDGDTGGAEPTTAAQAALKAADDAYTEARTAVDAATEAAEAARIADTPAARSKAAQLVATARTALTAAVDAADAALAAAEDGSDDTYGRARIAKTRADDYLTAQTPVLDGAQASYAWYATDLVRYTMLNGEVDQPADGANTVTIIRTDRTKDTSATDPTQIANTGDNVIKADTFKTIMHSANKRVFSDSGDEFKVEGYVGHGNAFQRFDTSLLTGLKITNSGIEIRTGGLRSRDAAGDYDSDYLDMRKRINERTGEGGTADVTHADNAWDLKITFNEPLSSTRSAGKTNLETNWFGNGDFYWRGIVPADPRQLDDSESDYYVAGTFTQAEGRKDLGLYEVWLSNHIGVNRGLEPVAGSGLARCPDGSLASENGGACPGDDENRYLDYAAYGLFVYTPDYISPDGSVFGSARAYQPDGTTQFGSGNWRAIWSVNGARIQSMYFGYSAFADSDGQRTKDISTAITDATFRGQTLARAYTGRGAGGNVSPENAHNRFLRADVELTVNIAKGDAGDTNIKGRLLNFEEWYDVGEVWVKYPEAFKAYLNADGTEDGDAVAIMPDGQFSGVSKFADEPGARVGSRPALDPSPSSGNQAQHGYLHDAGTGIFKGNFYGPRADISDLEVAGGWSVGRETAAANADRYQIVGSFGAKQWTAE